MGLSKLAKESKDLNASLTTFANGISSSSGDFDKRSNKDGGVIGNLNNIIDVAQNAVDFVSNLVGSRDPMYTIGQVESDWGTTGALLDTVGLGSVARGVASLVGYGYEQKGVIIDGIGTVSGSFGIDLPKNPMLYRSNYITDQRVRTPDTCSMKVYVNNYLSDDIVDMGLNYLSNKLGTVGKIASKTLGMFVNGGETRAQSAVYNLRWLQNNGIPFKVYTQHCVFENMLIKDFKLNIDESTMDTAVIDINFVELLMYTTNSNLANMPAKEYVNESGTIYDNIKKKAQNVWSKF